MEAALMEYELGQRFRQSYNLLVVLGPTASGKTELAVRLARRIGGEIISADSRQVYRGMDLGTGKDLSCYRNGETTVPCHLIDILDPRDEFSVFDYQQLFYRCFREITKRDRIPLLVGGTGLYLEAVIRGYHMPAVQENPDLREELKGEGMESLRRRLLAISSGVHNKTDLLERKRLIRAIEIAEFIRDHPYLAPDRMPISPLVMGVRCERETLRRNITARLDARLAAGLVEEVQSLHERGIGWERIDSFGLEYRY
ncbi:MAG: tRNA (adenosine(37)-N6)-dimethylallyltransferase MiaA, partial [Proteobacteria bacterium]|nr:tRNA (adenosine(37)-N6)-dimethylallyltransferase MiaA [Pseudomonadota bacterium]